MAATAPLLPHKLHTTCDPAKIPWKNSGEIPFERLCKNGNAVFQPRALQALEMALRIKNAGFHIYLSGNPDLGRSHMLLSCLKPAASQLDTPPDLVYVQNFSSPDAPLLLHLPAGHGRKFREAIQKLMDDIPGNLERRLATPNFIRERAVLMEKFQKIRSGLLSKMNHVAAHKGFNLDIDENGGLTLYPVSKGKKLDEDELASLDSAARQDIKRKGDTLTKDLVGLMRQLNSAEDSFHDDESGLERRAMTATLETLLDPLEQKFMKLCPSPHMKNFLRDFRADIIKNTDAFLPREQHDKSDEPRFSLQAENFLNRYSINLFVDNSGLHGAPLIVEDNPSALNLLGCVERESEMGALVTDFTLIRNGSLHRANGGFLVLHADDILHHPFAWEGLLRALRANQARIEDGGDMTDTAARARSLRPDPLDLNVKVILIGNEETYEYLLDNDDKFSRIFRIKAHMAESAERNAANIRLYLGQIAKIAMDAGLMPFDASALAWLVDAGSKFCEDQKRLSLKFPVLRRLMIEADALAAMGGSQVVDAAFLDSAHRASFYRANLVEEELMEEYGRSVIKVQTSGTAVGQVNGLSVTWEGDYEFGLPHRISCSVGVGHDGIIDLEREAELGGPIHTKAMLIIKSFLADLFARKKPLVLTASLYFEQSYGGIEGDSASGAELAALLSALADVPVRLDLAFTGALGQAGQIMAVGGVTRKIEGFYKVCARRGLTGTQGVLIPWDNIDHLMLSPEIVESVSRGQFAIYPVRDMAEALYLLTGLPAGKRRKNDTFTPGSIYDRVDRRLNQLGCHAQNAFRKQKSE